MQETYGVSSSEKKGSSGLSQDIVVSKGDGKSVEVSKSYDTAETAEESVEEGDAQWKGWMYEEDDDDEKECPICMETFEVDEIVSWSANPTCKHVFHHECIKEVSSADLDA